MAIINSGVLKSMNKNASKATTRVTFVNAGVSVTLNAGVTSCSHSELAKAVAKGAVARATASGVDEKNGERWSERAVYTKAEELSASLKDFRAENKGEAESSASVDRNTITTA